MIEVFDEAQSRREAGRNRGGGARVVPGTTLAAIEALPAPFSALANRLLSRAEKECCGASGNQERLTLRACPADANERNVSDFRL